ncbi:radical SAM domain-containing protein [Nitritalea halalkaliphila LW7]|uniref:7-carboxy-7-deazaguanine synthase n=1 Tax=Nitritalea halalkaliphila LW7 TaxID=1189621 RepID=I5C1K7_9BACT|nr:7-carboxy-7-deazaguanine synthase QueE [Nitritalea halalkaliphila]EIM75709.1 radical SAM domain-containing protein [Nitritalea halalkaliphila LW7]
MDTRTLSSQVRAGQALPIMESFYTVQGEGTFTGHAAYFIRIGGCDVGCVWCDVKDSWEAARWPIQSIEEIVAGARAYPGRLAVITGGEPLLYPLAPLTDALRAAGFQVHLETSGAHPFSGSFDWVVFSPKKFKAPHPSIFEVADELKVVVSHKSDFTFAQENASKMYKNAVFRLQPEWTKSSRYLGSIIEFVKLHPEWQISLQTHKFMEIP